MNVLKVNYATIFRWVQQYGPELERPPHLRPTNDSWRVDETYVEVGEAKYLRAVDSQGKTLDLLTALARCPSCQTVFRKALKAVHNQEPE